MEKKEWTDYLRPDNTVLYSEGIFGKFKLTVHHYMSLDDDYWVVSCEGLFDKIELRKGSALQAKIQAEAKLYAILRNALDSMGVGERDSPLDGGTN